MPSGVEQYRRWFQYETDAHEKVIRSLESVPAERRASPEFRKAVAILGHVAAARRVWLGRFAGTPPVGPLFPTDPALPDVVADLRAVHRLWADHLAGLTDADLGRVFEYRSLDGGRFRNRVEDILAQLFGHSSYHRGQIAMLVRAAGGEPAITDFVYWCRDPVADPGA